MNPQLKVIGNAGVTRRHEKWESGKRYYSVVYSNGHAFCLTYQPKIGTYIEIFMQASGLTVRETLYSSPDDMPGEFWITHRIWGGSAHSRGREYPRDEIYPVGTKVNLCRK